METKEIIEKVNVEMKEEKENEVRNLVRRILRRKKELELWGDENKKELVKIEKDLIDIGAKTVEEVEKEFLKTMCVVEDGTRVNITANDYDASILSCVKR